MFDLAVFQGLAADETAKTPTLSPMSVVLILAVFGELVDVTNWKGAGDELTPAEVDEIDAMVALLYFELTN